MSLWSFLSFSNITYFSKAINNEMQRQQEHPQRQRQRIYEIPQPQQKNVLSPEYNQLVQQKINQLCIIQISKAQKHIQSSYKFQRKIIAGILVILIASIIAYVCKDEQKSATVDQRIIYLQLEMIKGKKDNQYLQKLLNESRDEVNNLHKSYEDLEHKYIVLYKKIKKVQEIDHTMVINKLVQNRIAQQSNKIQKQFKDIVGSFNSQLSRMNYSAEKLIKEAKETIGSFNSQFSRMNYSAQKLIKEAKETIGSFSSQIQKINEFTQTLADEIAQLNINELSMEVKGYPIMSKNSDRFEFIINKNLMKTNFRMHYRVKTQNPLIIQKKSEENKEFIIVYTQRPLQKTRNSYFEMKIEKTDLGHISIGVISDEKLSKLDCGYCEAQTMYYIYAGDGKMYHGNIFKIITWSTKSKVDTILEKDTISLFYDYQWQQIVWYINEKYVGHLPISREDLHRHLYPFVMMTSRGDEISVIKK